MPAIQSLVPGAALGDLQKIFHSLYPGFQRLIDLQGLWRRLTIYNLPSFCHLDHLSWFHRKRQIINFSTKLNLLRCHFLPKLIKTETHSKILKMVKQSGSATLLKIIYINMTIFIASSHFLTIRKIDVLPLSVSPSDTLSAS